MQVSVIIPTYNRVQTLSRAIDSVLNQKSPVDEIIIVDDGSTDDTANQISRNYPNVKLIRQSNLGVSAARNAGIKQAGFEWIALLDSDDTWMPEKISAIQQAQQAQPDILLFHSEEIWIRNGVRVNPMNKHRKSGGWIFEHCLPLCVISPSAAVVHQSLLQSVSYFDETLPACEDYDLWLKICHQFPVAFLDRPLITKYGGHDDQLSGQFWGMDRFRIRSLERLLEQQQLTRQQYFAAESMLIQKLNILLNGAKKHNNQEVIDEFSPMLDRIKNSVNSQNSVAC
jgi:glycosyltransferase involved in cell wall biosynthesis